jgi:hypothetical protein
MRSRKTSISARSPVSALLDSAVRIVYFVPSLFCAQHIPFDTKFRALVLRRWTALTPGERNRYAAPRSKKTATQKKLDRRDEEEMEEQHESR